MLHPIDCTRSVDGPPACANQLEFPREERGELGHWAPGSLVPDKYDKDVCATELKLRSKILSHVREGWRPQAAFQVEDKCTPLAADRKVESDVDSLTSETSSVSAGPDVINDITNSNDTK